MLKAEKSSAGCSITYSILNIWPSPERKSFQKRLNTTLKKVYQIQSIQATIFR